VTLRLDLNVQICFGTFLSNNPSSAHQVTYLFGSRGIPDGYRHMNGYGSHTYKWVNTAGEEFFVKYHFIVEGGTKNLKADAACRLAGEDPDYATRDLYNHIASGKEVVWNFSVQVIPYDQGESYKWDIYDVTKIWPHSDYPLIPVGRMVLNRNPTNYFAEVEQAAFSPGNFVPGIEPSNDKMLQGRIFSYPDTHRHRVGANFHQIPINCPYMARVAHYQRDGPATSSANFGSEPNYEPNTIEGTPKQDLSYARKEFKVDGLAGRHPYKHPNCDFAQPGALFRKVFTDEEKTDIINNMGGHMRKATRRCVIERQCGIFYKCDPEYGAKLAQMNGVPVHGAKL